ncbi:MAG TPA: translation initiation factor IF-3, partial [Acidimicrobiaceae bacterium]|nr:translation initiation factor IF-3 [Acidimicrobiaceae bacterium]
MNEDIRTAEVRLVAPDGEQIGIKSLPEALEFARNLDLDLVEVAPGADPPVCRVMDYGKYRYEAAQRAKESRRKSSHAALKEMKYRPKIGRGDFDTKTSKVAGFLEEGHKVKITIMFRGREVFHPELGSEILERVADTVVEIGKVDQFPKLDGRNMTMVLSPDRRPGRKRRPGDGSFGDFSGDKTAAGDGAVPVDGPPAAGPPPAGSP